MRDCFACKFWLKLVSWFWRRPFLNFVNVFFTILLSSPFGIRWNPSFEQIWIPITHECFVPSLVEIGPLIIEKKIFRFLQFIFAILFLSPLGKRCDPLFEQTQIPFTHGCFVSSLVEIGFGVLDKKTKMWKFYENNNDTQLSIRRARVS